MTSTTVPTGLLCDVHAVLACAGETVSTRGWARFASERNGGLRIDGALAYASALSAATPAVHHYAFACTAVAIQPHSGIDTIGLLVPILADRYLDPATSDHELYVLDTKIITIYNREHCLGVDDAFDLFRTALAHAEFIVAAQLAHRPVPA